MIWDFYIFFAVAAILFWAIGSFAAWQSKRTIAYVAIGAGIIIFAFFIVLLWQQLHRPPLRTMGETRLWYAFFLALVGLLIYWHWSYRWIPLFTSLLATVFTLINVFKPEIHSITLMPALQSPWFIPHVTVYILSYAMLGMGTIVSLMLLYNARKGQTDANLYVLLDNTIYIGFGFLMLGLVTGALWAKEAWGNYWDWDPKETWAFITAVAYLAFIHLRLNPRHTQLALWLLPFAFILLMMAWIGVNYLPSAQSSIHVYYT